MSRKFIPYTVLIEGYIKELKLTAEELEKDLALDKKPQEILEDLQRRQRISSSLYLGATRKLKSQIKLLS